MKDLNKLSEELDELEKLRKSRLRFIVFIAFVQVLLIAVTVIAAQYDVYVYRLVFFTFLTPLTLEYPLGFQGRRYKKKFNSLIVRQALESYFEIEEFNSDYGISYNTIKSTGMLKECDKYKANDLITGTYKDIHFTQSDVQMINQHNIHSRYPQIVFSGRWMVFEFNKRFLCDMLIYEKGFRHTTVSDSAFHSSDRFEKVLFEDENFNSSFKVFAENQHEAFYILSPQMMEMLLQIKDSIKGDIIVIFHNNKMHIGVNNYKDAFEPPVFKKIDVGVIMEGINDDIGLITKMVDMLKLDRKIYKM